jgi:hypothetical protein
MSSYRIDAIMQWQKEGERRKQAKEEATQLPAESDEAFLARVEAMPEPRTWLQYATDPAGDGAPRGSDPDVPGHLDAVWDAEAHKWRPAPLNADSLLLDPLWATRIKGVDEDTVYYYRQMLEETYPGWKKGPKRWIEGMYPDVVSRTAASDFVPDPFNLFTHDDGTRVQAHDVGDSWYDPKRIAFNLAGSPSIAVGLLVICVPLLYLINRGGEAVIDTGVHAFSALPEVVEGIEEAIEEAADLNED